ncbi:MAG: Lrp/AsnC ligand binding domain-containing protein [Actinomycetota bacterium]|nr:Lrp/AsnC ligand binding domain-containing protein [Actinomycetota bacterium]
MKIEVLLLAALERAEVDLKKKAYVLITVSGGELESVMRNLSKMPEVLSVEGISGHADLVVIVVGEDLEALQRFILTSLRGIEGVQSTETWIVMAPQPETWTKDEIESYIQACEETELMAIKILLEKGRGVMVQELIDELAERLSDENFDVHSLTVTLTNMTRRAQYEYRRENIIEFEEDEGFFLDEKYLDILKEVLE